MAEYYCQFWNLAKQKFSERSFHYTLNVLVFLRHNDLNLIFVILYNQNVCHNDQTSHTTSITTTRKTHQLGADARRKMGPWDSSAVAATAGTWVSSVSVWWDTIPESTSVAVGGSWPRGTPAALDCLHLVKTETNKLLGKRRGIETWHET